MTQTFPSAAFGLHAIQTKSQTSFSAFANWLTPPSSGNDLHAGAVHMQPFASYETNFWLLDGSYKFAPDGWQGVHVGLLSGYISGSAGNFNAENIPSMRIYFLSGAQDITGLSFWFSPATGDYISQLRAEYYDATMTLIRDITYAPNSVAWSTQDPVDGVYHIRVYFEKTNRPYRRARVQAVDFGEMIWFGHDQIRGAEVIEECAPLSDELRAGTLALRLWSDDARFNILAPTGDYASLTERQPIAMYETVNGAQRLIGVFSLDTWQNRSEKEIEFVCTDVIGLMEHIPCRGGLWTTGIAVEDLLEAMLAPASIPYVLDETLVGTMVIGWIPAGTLRAALQQIAFAIGASVLTSRRWTLSIVPMKMAAAESATGTLARADKGMEQTVELRPQIAGVEVTAHTYVAGTQTRVLLSATLDAGTHEIVFDLPMHSLVATGATIAESGANYALLSVAAPGAVTLEGQEYVDTQRIAAIYAPEGASPIRPVLRVDQATLVHPGNLDAVTQRVFDYHQQRYEQKVRLYAPNVEVGQVVTVETLYGRQIRALIERMSLDLTRGMIADAEMVGVVVGA